MPADEAGSTEPSSWSAALTLTPRFWSESVGSKNDGKSAPAVTVRPNRPRRARSIPIGRPRRVQIFARPEDTPISSPHRSWLNRPSSEPSEGSSSTQPPLSPSASPFNSTSSTSSVSSSSPSSFCSSQSSRSDFARPRPLLVAVRAQGSRAAHACRPRASGRSKPIELLGQTRPWVARVALRKRCLSQGPREFRLKCCGDRPEKKWRTVNVRGRVEGWASEGSR